MAKTMLSIYQSRLKQTKDLADSHWQRAIDNYKHYFGRLDAGAVDEEAYPFYSKMSVSISYEVIETIMPRLIGRDPEFSCVAQEPDDVDREELAKLVVETQYNNPKLELLGEPIYLKLQRMVKECLITGNAVGRPMWRRQTRQMVKYLASLERAGIKDSDKIMDVVAKAQKLGAEDEVRYGKKFADMPFLDDFDLTHLPFYFYFGDLPMIEPGRMRFQMERTLMDFDELSDEAKRFEYSVPKMNELKEKWDAGKLGFTQGGDSAVSKDFMFEYQDLFALDTRRTHQTDDEKIPMMMVDKMWTSDGRVHVFVNESHALTGEDEAEVDANPSGIENPYDVKKAPFIHVHDVVIPHSYYSRGEIDPIKKLEDGSNDLMNMRFDNLLQSMLNYWLYNPKMIANNDEFVPVPNSTTAVKDVDKAVKMISGNDVTGAAYNEANLLSELIKSVSGTKDYVQGNEGQTLAGRTYGGMRMVQEVYNARFLVKSKLFEKVTLKALGYFILEFSKQFMSKDRVVRIAGELADSDKNSTKKIEVGKLKSMVGFMDMKIMPNSATVLDQQAEIGRLNSMADRFKENQGAFKDIPNEVYDKFLLKYFLANGVTDAVYWVRAISKARSNKEKGGTVTPNNPDKMAESLMGAIGNAGAAGSLGVTPGGAPPVPGMTPTATLPTQPVLQSDQGFVNQPDPLAQIMSAEQAIPTA